MRKLAKVYIYAQDFSPMMRRGREAVTEGGKVTYKNKMLPKCVFWRCMDIIESAAMNEYKFVFKSLVAIANQVNLGKDTGKDTPDCRVFSSTVGEHTFLHVYLYSEERDDEFKETYHGKQIPIDGMKPLGRNVIELTHIDYYYQGKEDSRIKTTFNTKTASLMKPLTINSPEACSMFPNETSLSYEFVQGSNLYEIIEVAESEMQEKFDNMPSHAEIMEEREILSDRLKEKRMVDKPTSLKKSMTLSEFSRKRPMTFEEFSQKKKSMVLDS